MHSPIKIRTYMLAAIVALVAVPSSASAYIYWPHDRAPLADGAIGRANVDGSAPDPTLVTGTDAVGAVTVSGTHVYWTHFVPGGVGAIGRANLDGSDADPKFIAGLQSPRGIAVQGAHIYWTDFGASSIGRANLDGSDVERDFIKAPTHAIPPAHPTALGIDRNHIYFSDTAFNALVIAKIEGHGNWLLAKVHHVGTVTGRHGSGAAGAVAVTDTMRPFGLHPQVVSGSGESLRDLDSPRDVVGLLRLMYRGPYADAFQHSLSQAGRNGSDTGYAGTAADGRCALKGGTRLDFVQSKNTLDVSGYCRSVGGRRFAFAVMMIGVPMKFVPPDRIVSPAYALQHQIVNDLAGYRG